MSATIRTSPAGTRTTPVDVAVTQHYTATAQALHWVTAALMFVVVPLAWVMVSVGETDPSRGLLYNLHKSIGMTILVLVAVRLLWRSRHHAPPLRRIAPWEANVAFASHWLLYVVLVGMPVSGYLLSSMSGHPVNYFGLFTLPSPPNNVAWAKAAVWVHVAVGQWAVYALVTLHLVATAWHLVVRRDGVLDRMLPEQDGV